MEVRFVSPPDEVQVDHQIKVEGVRAIITKVIKSGFFFEFKDRKPNRYRWVNGHNFVTFEYYARHPHLYESLNFHLHPSRR